MGRHTTIGRHSSPTTAPAGGRRSYWYIGAAIVAVALLVTGLVVFTGGGHHHSAAGAGTSAVERSTAPASASSSSTGGSGHGPGAACPDGAALAVPPGYATAFTQVSQAFATTSSGCQLAVTSTATPAATSNAAGAPTLWLAETPTALATMPAGSTTASTATPTVATSPLVVAFPAPLAQALGWPQQQFNTQLLQSLLLGTRSWTSLGHSAWGGFRLVVPNPAAAGSGAAAYNALVTISHGGPLTTTPGFVNPSPADLATIRVEQSVASTAANDQAVLASATTLSTSLAATSGYVTTEAALRAHNATSGALPLDGFYLAGGHAAVDFHAVALDANSSSAASKALTAFTSFLATPSGAAALRSAGVRDAAGQAPTDPSAGLPAATDATPALLTSAAAIKVATLWSFMHTRDSTLALVDVSASMSDPFPGSTTSKIDVVRAIMQASYVVASPKARSGVWYFNSAPDGTPTINTASGLALNAAPAKGGGTHSQYVVAQAAHLAPTGGTPLYLAVQKGYANAVANYQPGLVNQLVVLTDGRNEDSTSSLTLAALVASIKQLTVPGRPVKVILFGIGSDADLASLRAIAAAAHGVAVGISSPAQVPAAVTTALFS